MKNSDLTIKLRGSFPDHTVITTREIADVLAEVFPELSSNTISWRINQLKAEKLIFQVGRGLYSFDFKPDFIPEISLKSKRLYNRIKPYCKQDICIWDTILLEEISGRKCNKYFAFVSAPKEELDDLFNNMLDLSKQVFLQPDKEVIRRYLLPQDEAIILTSLLSETPLINLGGYITPTIEGILINSYFKKEDYLEPIGFDIHEIFQNSFREYNINQSKLLRFASRRDKRTEIANYIKTL